MGWISTIFGKRKSSKRKPVNISPGKEEEWILLSPDAPPKPVTLEKPPKPQRPPKSRKPLQRSQPKATLKSELKELAKNRRVQNAESRRDYQRRNRRGNEKDVKPKEVPVQGKL